MRVATWNIEREKDGWSEKRQDRIRQTLDRLTAEGEEGGIDFLGLQEVGRHASYRLVRDRLDTERWGDLGEYRWDGPYAEANRIFYRRDRWSLRQSGTYWLSKTPDVPGSRSWGVTEPRTVSWGRFVSKRTRRVVWVWNTHLSHLAPHARRKSMHLLESWLRRVLERGEPAVLLGDFNATYWDLPVFARFKRLGMRPTLRPGWLRGTWLVRAGFMLDYVWVPDPAKIRSAGLPARAGLDVLASYVDHGARGSDHFPVVAELDFAALEK